MTELPDSVVEVSDPAEFLRDQQGIFAVTSPQGHLFQVTCRRGTPPVIRELSEPKPGVAPISAAWRVKKLNSAVA